MGSRPRSAVYKLLIVLIFSLSSLRCHSKSNDKGSDSSSVKDLFTSQLAKAREKWSEFKKKEYRYEVSAVSPDGSGTFGVVAVDQDKVERIEYFAYDRDGIMTSQYIESASKGNLGTHPGGTAVATVEQIFDECQNHIDQKWQASSDTDINITFDDTGNFNCSYDAKGQSVNNGAKGLRFAICEKCVSLNLEQIQKRNFRRDLVTVQAKWEGIKRDSSSGYRYKVEFSSSPFGNEPRTTTIVSVRNDVVVARDFTRLVAGKVDGEYHETASDIGSHQDGAPAATMEQLFVQCKAHIDGKWNIFEFVDMNIYMGDTGSFVCTYYCARCADGPDEGIYTEML